MNIFKFISDKKERCENKVYTSREIQAPHADTF